MYEKQTHSSPAEHIVWFYVKYQQGLFEKVMKINVEYVEGIAGELDKYFKKNKRISLYWMILCMKHQVFLKLLNCLHVVVMIYLT